MHTSSSGSESGFFILPGNRYAGPIFPTLILLSLSSGGDFCAGHSESLWIHTEFSFMLPDEQYLSWERFSGRVFVVVVILLVLLSAVCGFYFIFSSFRFLMRNLMSGWQFSFQSNFFFLSNRFQDQCFHSWSSRILPEYACV